MSHPCIHDGATINKEMPAFLQVEVPEVFKDVGGWRYSAATVRVQQAGLLPAWEQFAMLQQRHLAVPVAEFSELP
jgi:hypothetical protein